MTSDEPQNEAPLPPRSPFDRGKSHMSILYVVRTFQTFGLAI